MPHRPKGKPRRRNIKPSKGKKEWKPTSKAGRIVVRNLSFEATEDGIEEHFLQYGDIRDVKLLRRQDGKLVGCGFVQFTRKEAAEEAIKNCNGKLYMGRKIKVAWAVPKSEFIATKVLERKSKVKTEEDNDPDIKEESLSGDDINEADSKPNNASPHKPHVKTPKKKGRIIVRNLPFKVTEDIFRKHFEKFGEILEVKLLRKPDGKLVGCGFVQFKTKQSAIRAILNTSGKELMGRTIICDWALPKDKYVAHLETDTQSPVKEEVKDEKSQEEEEAEEEVKSLNGDEIKEEVMSQDSDVEEGTADSEADEESESTTDEKPEFERAGSRVVSNDVSEGRTVFVKNIPFSATNEDLKACMEKFGPIFYALICMDPLTEHSKGTGFVKFTTKESADMCLSGGTDLVIHDQQISVFPALNKEDTQKRTLKEKNKTKDSRHLYLVKEGVVLAGSPAAKGVSLSDMQKRLQLEQWKSQILRNLNMFVSKFRLVVHNLPPTWNDVDVKKLFLKHAGPGAVITEARVMRDMRNVDAQGVGKSKEMAFVKFTSHEHALQALRNINNNPDIFTKSKRPIVSFSIENKAIHKVLQRRIQKSRAKNPLNNRTENTVQSEGLHPKSQTNRNTKKRKISDLSDSVNEPKPFSGVTAEPGNKKMRSKFNLRVQSAIHTLSVRKDKQKQKVKQKRRENRVMKQPQPKKSKISKDENDTFNNLVNKYKNKLTSLADQKKWYE
ncbi:RNA-binding protein 28 [Anabrus simplex]|uniref:RNA-binding protein 28 n=1 Tax=Anabrus simplex TaxID=316456 RepID=UPI0035A2D987